MPRPPLDHFRFIAPFYDRIFDHESTTQGLPDLLALPVRGWLLDAGGGTGRIAQTVHALTGGVVVVDVSDGMLRQAKAKNGLRPVHAHVERLPFADGQFERILIVDAFHHFHEHEQAVRELLRVLQPGGRLLVEEPNIERWSVRVVALMETLALMRSRFFRPQAMRRMFEAHGARVALDTTHPIHARLTVEKPGAP